MTAMAPPRPRAVSVVPSIGSTAMSVSIGRAVPDPLAVEQHGRFVLLALADDDDAVHRDGVEHDAHGVDGGPVGAVLVASAHPAAGGQGGGLGGAHELEREVAVGALLGGHEQARLKAQLASPGGRVGPRCSSPASVRSTAPGPRRRASTSADGARRLVRPRCRDGSPDGSVRTRMTRSRATSPSPGWRGWTAPRRTTDYELDEWTEPTAGAAARPAGDARRAPPLGGRTTLVISAADEAWVERIMDQVEDDLVAGARSRRRRRSPTTSTDWDDASGGSGSSTSSKTEAMPYGVDGDELLRPRDRRAAGRRDRSRPSCVQTRRPTPAMPTGRRARGDGRAVRGRRPPRPRPRRPRRHDGADRRHPRAPAGAGAIRDGQGLVGRRAGQADALVDLLDTPAPDEEAVIVTATEPPGRAAPVRLSERGRPLEPAGHGRRILAR